MNRRPPHRADIFASACARVFALTVFVLTVFSPSVFVADSAADSDSEPLTYHSEEVGCDWLDAEYETIQAHAADSVADSDSDSDSDSPAVTSEGAALTFGMLLTLPFSIAGEIFGDKKPRFNFSRDRDDLIVAAKTKKCAALLQKIEGDAAAPRPQKSDAKNTRP